jgi:AcrR family transcriptional regulator
MPRDTVNDTPLPARTSDPRRSRILDAARRCFIRNGFHATSMRDVTAEARIPFTGVTRYFRGRDEVIQAFADETEAEVHRVFAAAFGRLPRPVEAFPHVEQGFPGLAVKVWSSALRASVLDEQEDEAAAELTRALLWYVELYQRTGLITRDMPALNVIRTLVTLVHGYMVQRTLFGEVDTRAFREGLRGLR